MSKFNTAHILYGEESIIDTECERKKKIKKEKNTSIFDDVKLNLVSLKYVKVREVTKEESFNIKKTSIAFALERLIPEKRFLISTLLNKEKENKPFIFIRWVGKVDKKLLENAIFTDNLEGIKLTKRSEDEILVSSKKDEIIDIVLQEYSSNNEMEGHNKYDIVSFNDKQKILFNH